MKRKLFVIASFGIIALMVLLLGGTAFGETQAANALPEVEFLGEGPGSFNTTLDDFIVKRSQEQYDFVDGPTYEAAEGERVWAVRGTKEAPTAINNTVHSLGTAYENCTVEYVGIDDDVNGIRNGFFLGGNLVELIMEGMVFEGSYVSPVTTPDHRLVAEESIAYWYTPCEEGEATATPTEPAATATSTNTPEPGDEVIMYMPLILYIGEGQPQPTATPTTPPDATATTVPPTATSTATPETKTYSVTCDQEYKINIVDEEMHFKFAATAFADGEPFEDVDLKGTLDTGSQTPFNIESTNFDGVADFTIAVLVGSISQSPVATVTFNDQGTYGNASCTVDFSIALPPIPTPTPPPVVEPELVCDDNYVVKFNESNVAVEFKFAANASYNGYLLSDVDLKAVLDSGFSGFTQTVETNFDGVADFKILVAVTDITQTPLVTVTFDDEETYGNASCTIDSAESNAFWAAVIERSANGK